MKDIFNGFYYACEKISEDGVDYRIKGQVEKHLFQNLFTHIKELKEIYDEECK